ncbi:NAD(P)/FAD-dependent oxidoreductase [Ponticoccus alexandrii]|uniref:FAD-dependent oxidoreductase n=1 Tax=Ponticoccus alexandrii TaxID=1943633 RepID=A0ABX7FGZ0_9RHOB|nr:FAD-binding oxidoreductase [Ponticoccus alexandrii]ETA49374.2 oxidoreductase [Rhodobacteraceae bacterium PD-2]QRF69299.1 FAD-dependent oxidoreductase [Ponticoccus alexandrii]
MSQDARAARSAMPYWWEAAPPTALPQTPLCAKVDVVVVGAGFAGLSAALVMARAGRSVTVFDAMRPGEGASSRNGGITSGNIRPSFATISKRFGEKVALGIEAEGKTAREFLRDFIATERLECDYSLIGNFKGALGYDQYDTMARTAETLGKRLGIDTYAVPHAEQQGYIGTEFYRGGTVRMDIGGLHPGKFHAEMLRVALTAGVNVHGETRVSGISRDGTGFRVATARGSVAARQVLVCTNGYTDSATPYLQRRLIPVRSRIIATEDLPVDVMDRLIPRRMTMGENRQLGYYYRPSPDGRKILLGGRDASRRGDPLEPTLRLRAGLAQIFPELEDVTLSHSWFGNVAMNRDMLPRLFEHDGIFYATGFCGSGVVWAPWVGSRAAHRLLGAEAGQSAFASRAPAAVPLYRGDPWFVPAIIKGYALQDHLAMRRARR